MAFEIYVPLVAQCPRVLPGFVNFAPRVGRFRFNSIDLAKISLTHRVTVLMDKSTGRMALKKPSTTSATLGLRWNKSRTSAELSCEGLLKVLSIDAKALATRTLTVEHKDDLLIVQLRDGFTIKPSREAKE